MTPPVANGANEAPAVERAQRESASGTAAPSAGERDWVITLDGPAASGKSSVARLVADALEAPFISSGLLYRAAAHLTIEGEIDADDAGAILRTLHDSRVQLLGSAHAPNRVIIDGRDASDRMHTDAVDAIVSAVSRHPDVRDWVFARLREIPRPFVIDGRDMGTVVFPDAPYKFYLTAPAEVRARRRVGERSASLDEVTASLRRRDELDALQLAPAADAVHIDTADMTIHEVVQAVLEAVRKPA